MEDTGKGAENWGNTSIPFQHHGQRKPTTGLWRMDRAALKWFVATCLHLLALPDSDQPSTRPSKPSLSQPQHRHHHHIRPLSTFALNVTDALQFCSSPPSVTLTIKSFPIHQSWVAILSLSKFFPLVCVLFYPPL